MLVSVEAPTVSGVSTSCNGRLYDPSWCSRFQVLIQTLGPITRHDLPKYLLLNPISRQLRIAGLGLFERLGRTVAY